MTITIGTFSTSRLTTQPFGYEGEARDGLTARTFTVAGLLSSTEWQALVSEYNTWRNLRIADTDTLASGEVGTTVNLAITSTNGLTVTDLLCWFVDPPSGDQLGPFINATATLVDADQALAVLLRGEEKNRQRSEDLPNLGTVTLTRTDGTSPIITLTRPMLTRRDGPDVALTAGGVSYITGPLAAHKLRDIEGYLTTGTFDDVLAWYDETISTIPLTGVYFPVSAPTATAEVIITEGVKATRFTVQVSAVEIMV
jgi:hypothetical protein